MDSTTVSTTFLHAITFLLAPLASHYPAPVLDALHLSLLSTLSRLDISSRPQTLLLSPTAPPPSIIAIALQGLRQFPVEMRVHWADWMLLLGNGNQLMLTIVPGCVQVTVRDVATGVVNSTTVWNAALQARAPSPWGACTRSRSSAPGSSSDSSSAESVSSRASSPVIEDVVAVEAAETVLNDDDEIFYPVRTSAFFKQPVQKVGSSLSAAAPEWFPSPAIRPTHSKSPSVSKMAPVGTKRAPFQGHSRSSSRSSTISAAPSLISSYSSASSASTLTSALNSLSLTPMRQPPLSTQSTGSSLSPASSSPVPPSPVPSDTSDAADTTFYIDASKDQLAVTEYECGKVGVLTGAVMLGVPKGKPAHKVVGSKVGVRRL